MTTQPPDLKKLREVAEGLAKPAYWFTAGFDDRTGHWFSGSSDGHEGENDLPFIASKAILALLDAYEASARDADRLDWLDGQAEAYGFEDCHEGNRGTLDGPFNTAREAIDATREYIDARHATQGD